MQRARHPAEYACEARLLLPPPYRRAARRLARGATAGAEASAAAAAGWQLRLRWLHLYHALGGAALAKRDADHHSCVWAVNHQVTCVGERGVGWGYVPKPNE